MTQRIPYDPSGVKNRQKSVIITDMKKEDLRVQRTNRLLREALTSLINESGYDRITIRDITQQAQVGYKTFFRHFDSKEALAQAILADMIKEFQQTTRTSSAPDNPYHNTLTAVRFAQAQAPLVLAVMVSPLANQVEMMFTEFAKQDVARAIDLKKLDIPRDLATFHAGSSILKIVLWWLKNGMKQTPEELTGYIIKLVFNPLPQK